MGAATAGWIRFIGGKLLLRLQLIGGGCANWLLRLGHLLAATHLILSLQLVLIVLAEELDLFVAEHLAVAVLSGVVFALV